MCVFVIIVNYILLNVEFAIIKIKHNTFALTYLIGYIIVYAL